MRILMDNLELINQLLYDFVNKNYYLKDKTRINLFNYTESLKILLYENMPFIYARKYKRKMPLDESIKKAREFLEYLDPVYALYLDLRLNDGSFEVESEKEVRESNDEEKDFYSMSGIYEDKSRFIRIVYEGTFSDVYAIIHEVLHDTNLIIPPSEDEMTDYERSILSNRDNFTELISILGTLIARNYFVSKGEKEADIDMMNEYISGECMKWKASDRKSMLQFCKMLFGNLDFKLGTGQSADLLNSFAFCNYLQVPDFNLVGRQGKDEEKLYEDSKSIFNEYLEEIKPEKIIVWGNHAYHHIVKLGKRIDDRKCRITMQTGHIIDVLRINHPCVIGRGGYEQSVKQIKEFMTA